ncbi:MFS transporter [Burkholderia sp. AU19243]|uniref:MFS transporter n=1 Tax=Burkholderia sp. AU19243 TaxID=2824810 RepID=UPI001B91433F|nr:MFS transporter [Burkholderia sp. AU19243]MBR8144454.1 MFS transporter [Burkholderia vietnamiensis]MBR8362476.1 MFS transporter [Burkholderia sp. AU19243]
MIDRTDSAPKDTASVSPDPARSRWMLVRWVISSATLNVPQAAGPIAFSLLALSMTGKASGGAAMILAMTLAQVAGVIPLTRFGAQRPAAAFLRVLVGARSLALLSIAVGAWCRVPFSVAIGLAACAGLVNGAAHGYVRVVLNQLGPSIKLPRALGIAATLNEVTFGLAPVAASGLGLVSPSFAIVVIAMLGAIPALMIPDTGLHHARSANAATRGNVLTMSIALWLICSTAGASAVAAVEIGAVALALRFGHQPAFAVFFTVPLCIASVAGGVWVSIRNRMSTRNTVVVQLSVMMTGSFLTALGISAWTTVLGAVLIGSVVAPLGTHYSLALDALAPPQRRAEVFAWLRTANATGVIFTSAVLTTVPLSTALVAVTSLVMATVAVVACVSISERLRHGLGIQPANATRASRTEPE